MWTLLEVDKSGNFVAVIATFKDASAVYRYLFNAAKSWNMTFVQRSVDKNTVNNYELWDEDTGRVLFYRALLLDYYE